MMQGLQKLDDLNSTVSDYYPQENPLQGKLEEPSLELLAGFNACIKSSELTSFQEYVEFRTLNPGLNNEDGYFQLFHQLEGQTDKTIKRLLNLTAYYTELSEGSAVIDYFKWINSACKTEVRTRNQITQDSENSLVIKMINEKLWMRGIEGKDLRVQGLVETYRQKDFFFTYSMIVGITKIIENKPNPTKSINTTMPTQPITQGQTNSLPRGLGTIDSLNPKLVFRIPELPN